MEPVTHFLTGACLGRAGFNRKTAYATLAAALAAEAADLDMIWEFAGPVKEFKHHRGITHTFWAVPVVAGVVVGTIWLFHRWRTSRLRPKKAATPADPLLQNTNARTPQQSVHWGWLYLVACIAALTHLLLDWTNNYGIRPFFPFNPRWYAGSIMFIAEPVLWALFFFAFFAPWISGLTDREIGARQKPFRGQAWAIFALAGMLILGCWRWAEHAQANAMLENTQVASEPVSRIALEPYPLDPFRWHAILDTPDFYQTAEVNTRTGSIDSDPRLNVLYKPTDTPAIEAAKRTLLGQVYLDWGTWAVIRDMGQEPAPGMDPPNLPPNRQWTAVQFNDLRFDYSFLARHGSGRAPLDGWVYIVDGHDEAAEAMGERQQH